MDHYQFLGVHPSATVEELARAIERVHRQANAFATTDPERSQALREQLRRVRADLLTSPASRAAYDAQLAGAHDATVMISRDAPWPPPGAEVPVSEETRWIPVPGQGAGPMRPSGLSSRTWALLAALVLVALVLGGLGGFVLFHASGSNGSAAPIVPTATPQPTTIAPTATPQPTATLLPTITSIPPTPIPAPTVDPIAHDLQVIEAKGYTPDESQHAETDDGSGGTLHAWLGRCTNSGDGYCQWVFFFVNAHFLGTDTFAPSTQIMHVAAAGPQAIAVTYANYLSGDPNCCPTGSPVTITYTWTGSKLESSGTPPGHT